MHSNAINAISVNALTANFESYVVGWGIIFRLENAAETLVSSGGGDGEEIEAALVELCNLCQERSSFSQIVEDKNLIPRILALTSFQLESIQLKSMECLCYLARQDNSKVRAFLVCAKILEHGKAGPGS